ncbi:MAG: hypothetical protein GY898_08580 [Proteobacteria bacterium]|nr:hypothetical protein [Pseudomonadota bacterium]
MTRLHWLALLTLLGLLLVIPGCPPPEGNLDDDDTSDGDDDDDDDDDDTTPPDDDDFTIPPGIPLGGVIEYSPADGEVPAGAVRVGLFAADPEGFAPGEERWSNEVVGAEGGLLGGDNIYTVYVDGDPEEDEDFFPGGLGWEVALYFLFAYVDGDASDDYNPGDPILGSSTDLFGFVRSDNPEAPDELVALGGGLGWNVVDYLSLGDDGEPDITHRPDGTNSSNGPELSVELLPQTSGTIPVSTSLFIPNGSAMGAFHLSIFGGEVIDDFLQFPQAVGNGELRGDTLAEWNITGPPPAAHLAPLEGFGLNGAYYLLFAWYDDGDLDYIQGTCDTPLAVGFPSLLMYIDPAALTLQQAFQSQIFGFPMGWTLFDQELEAPRPFTTGIQLEHLSSLDDGGGDDDDSAGDDDDSSAGDDDDSAAPLDPVDTIPAECLPPSGDDDDSAGDDDDSADDDDDSAGD